MRPRTRASGDSPGRGTLPLAVRLRFSEVQSALREITAPQTVPAFPVMANVLSRQAALTHAGTRTLLLWRLEHHHTAAGTLVSSPPWPTAESHRTGDLAPAALEILEDCARTWRRFASDGLPEHQIVRSALAVAAIRLAGQGKTEFLEQGLHDDALADVLQIGRLALPAGLLTGDADLGGDSSAEDALIDQVPVVLHTRTRVDDEDLWRVAATLLEVRRKGADARRVHLWVTRQARLLTFSAPSLLRVPLNDADAAWNDLTP